MAKAFVLNEGYWHDQRLDADRTTTRTLLRDLQCPKAVSHELHRQPEHCAPSPMDGVG